MTVLPSSLRPRTCVAEVAADKQTGSGLASCVGTVPKGSLIDTSTAGQHSFSVTVTDRAGNVTGLGSSHYFYGWETSAAWAGTCRQFQLQLNDGMAVHSATFMSFA